MSNNVVKFYAANAATQPDAVLEQAVGLYNDVFIIGYDSDGVLDVRSSTNVECKDILWMLESFKHRLLAGDYSDRQETH